MTTELETRQNKIQTYAKYGGAAVVVGAASTVVAVAAASAAVAATVAVAALFMVNVVVPVAARSFAVWRVRMITSVTEAFSEETIREDETKEQERIQVLQEQYKNSRAELEGAQEELESQLKTAEEDEKPTIKAQIAQLQSVIDDAETTIQQRMTDFEELKRVNKQYVAFHRAAKAMLKAQGAKRNAQELQQIEIARSAIKTRMRAAMAGKTIEAMNNQIRTPEGATVQAIRRTK